MGLLATFAERKATVSVFATFAERKATEKIRPAGFEPATLGSEGLDTTGIHRPPKVTQLVTANALRTPQQAPLACSLPIFYRKFHAVPWILCQILCRPNRIDAGREKRMIAH